MRLRFQEGVFVVDFLHACIEIRQKNEGNRIWKYYCRKIRRMMGKLV